MKKFKIDISCQIPFPDCLTASLPDPGKKEGLNSYKPKHLFVGYLL